MKKYAQSAIATTGMYDASPGAGRRQLAGFYDERHARILTGPARPAIEHDEAPIRATQKWFLQKSVVPLKRDKVRRRVK